jgi:hypothetical protein
MFTAVPKRPNMPLMSRYLVARAVFQDLWRRRVGQVGAARQARTQVRAVSLQLPVVCACSSQLAQQPAASQQPQFST